MVKRYALFEGEDYYPAGGWNDWKGSYDTPEEAVAAACGQWWHVVDLLLQMVVARSE